MTEVELDLVKISANLPAPLVETLREIAKARGTTMTEVLRHAISLEKFFLDTRQERSKILIEKPNGDIRELMSL